MKYAALVIGFIVWAGLLFVATDPKPEPRPEFDYAQMVSCLDARGFPFNTLAESENDLRFCIGFDQDVRR